MKPQLEEINVMRPIVIFLLVLVHTFTIYDGGWSLPEGIESVRAYFWIQKFSFAFMLETFVFISGYILGYQIYELKRELTLKQLLM